ncbi:MAG TPA: bestrophin family ion channel [Bordetella sp.]
MIIRPTQHWLRLLFVWHGSVLQSILPQLLLMTGIGVAAVLTHGQVFGEKVPLNATPFTLCGVALTIFMAFRNNASYARYVEARHLWGNLLIATRTLTSQALAYIPPGAGFAPRPFTHELIGFVHALKHQLRKTDPAQALAAHLEPALAQQLARQHYRPIAILRDVRQRLSGLQRRAVITDNQLWMLDTQLVEMEKTVGGCERLASTPIPFAYGVLLHRTVYAYCALLPFGLVDSTGVFTPFVSVFVAYTFLALEAIASEITDPFGTAPNHLALNAITCTIERSLLELSGETMPDEAKPARRYQLT